MDTMRKVAALDEGGYVSVIEDRIPDPGPGEILIKVHASLVSPGTELGGARSKRLTGSQPGGRKRAFGYSNAGAVIATGDGVDRFEIGQRVACMGGGYAQHATHARVPINLSVPIPDKVSYQEAAFNHLAATALHAVQRGRVQICENVVIFGLGLVGQLSCQIAKIAGAHVMAVDRLPMRLEKASANGADCVVNVDEQDPVEVAKEFTRGYGMDCGIICFGGDGSAAFEQIYQMLKRAPDTHHMGRITIVGGAHIAHGFAASLGNVDVLSAARTGPGYHDESYERGVDYPPVFVEWSTQRNLEEVLRFIEEGKLDVRSLITHEYPLEQAGEGCDKLILTPEQTLGVVFRPN